MGRLLRLVLTVLLLWSSPVRAEQVTVYEVNEIAVSAIVEYEFNHIVKLVSMPWVSVSIIEWGGYLGFTAVNTEEYSIYLRSNYPSAGLAHYVVAHELGHVWLLYNNQDNSEYNADQFAMCYGSEEAQKYGYALFGKECDQPGWEPPLAVARLSTITSRVKLVFTVRL